MIKLNNWLISAWKAKVSTPAAGASVSAMMTASQKLAQKNLNENDQTLAATNPKAGISNRGKDDSGEQSARAEIDRPNPYRKRSHET